MNSQKPKYNTIENSFWMIRIAKEAKELQVPLTAAGLAATAVLQSTVGLLLPPAVLRVIERKGSVWELLSTVLLFTAALIIAAAAHRYLDTIQLYPRVTVRTAILGKINKKCATTSYANLFDEHFEKLRENAQTATMSNNQATEASWNTMTLLLQGLFGFIVYLFLMAALPWWVLLFVFMLSVSLLLPGQKLSMYRYQHQEELAAHEKRIYYLCEDTVKREFLKDIRIFGLRPWIIELTDRAVDAYYAFHRRASARELITSLLAVLVTFLRNGIAYAVLIGMVLRREIDISAFLLYFTAIEGFSSFVGTIVENLVKLHRESLDLSLVREFLEFPESFRFQNGKPVPEEKEYTLELRHVSFRYPGASEDTLHDISVTLHPGEKLAIVGLNGAGKTTLVKLLAGFHDPTEGAVLLNGTDIREFNREDYYRLFSAVFQTFNLMAVTVRQTIAQTTEGIDDLRVRKCIEDAGLTEKVSSLKNGPDTLLNREVYEEAAEFSGGEMQKLCLARALYKDAPFVFLDEPTAALDPLAEEDIYRKYDSFTEGKSSVFISHRLASTRFCDRIILISDGRICEEGSHEELIARGGEYAALFEEQAKYYREHAERERGRAESETSVGEEVRDERN